MDSARAARASSRAADASTPAAARSARLSAAAISASAAATTAGDPPAAEAAAAAAASRAAVATASCAEVSSAPVPSTRSRVTRATSARSAIADASEPEDVPRRIRPATVSAPSSTCSSYARARRVARFRRSRSDAAAAAAKAGPGAASLRSASAANAAASAAREMDPPQARGAEGTPAALASLDAIATSCARCSSSSRAAASAAAAAASRSAARALCISSSAVWYPPRNASTRADASPGRMPGLAPPPYPYAAKSGQNAAAKSGALGTRSPFPFRGSRSRSRSRSRSARPPGDGGETVARGGIAPAYHGTSPANTFRLASALRARASADSVFFVAVTFGRERVSDANASRIADASRAGDFERERSRRALAPSSRDVSSATRLSHGGFADARASEETARRRGGEAGGEKANPEKATSRGRPL